MFCIQRAFAANRQAHTVDRDRKTAGQRIKLRQRAAALAHVVFRMDFEPACSACVLHDVGKMLGFIAKAGGQWQGTHGGVEHRLILREKGAWGRKAAPRDVA